ncbi:MAG: NAD(+)/NADH kinase [Thermomicrobiales bacterium]|nr:NAD(+)/NADH kinase [Thermomicrobiales bacterium]
MTESHYRAQQQAPTSVGLVAALSKPEAQELAPEITRFLTEHDVTVVPERALSPDATSQVGAIIVLGGDGLMMRAAQSYADVPLLGINFGKVGFLAHVERDDWRPALEAVVAGNFAIQESSTLDATIESSHGSEPQGWAINDVVIRSGVRMIDIEVYVDGYFVNTYPGDGMIVATSRGSTAYCMAAGGPILTTGVRGFAIVPISCHSPIRTPLVVDESAQIDLLFTSRHDASLILDGKVTSELAPDDVVAIRRGKHSCRLISVANTDFYEAFRTKFNFRIRPDAAATGLPSTRKNDVQ